MAGILWEAWWRSAFNTWDCGGTVRTPGSSNQGRCLQENTRALGKETSGLRGWRHCGIICGFGALDHPDLESH